MVSVEKGQRKAAGKAAVQPEGQEELEVGGRVKATQMHNERTSRSTIWVVSGAVCPVHSGPSAAASVI